MKCGVLTKHRSAQRDRSAQCHPQAGFVMFAALLAGLLLASTATASPASVGLGTAASFSVLGGSTVTNTGPTTMFGDLGLSPGSSVTGAPVVLGQTHVDDALAIEAENSLTTAYSDAALRPSEGSAGTDLSGQTFAPGVHTASGSLLLSSGSVILNAEGNPNAVFIFQIGSTLTTGSNTAVQLVNGAQACNVFWQVGSSATLGTGTRFVGTVMAATTITANTAATIHGRLLAQTAAVNLDTNTITTSTCASSESGSGGGTEASTPEETAALEAPSKGHETSGGETTPTGQTTPTPTTSTTATSTTASTTTTAAAATTKLRPIAPHSTSTERARAARRKAAARRRARRAANRRHTQARPASPGHRGAFTG